MEFALVVTPLLILCLGMIQYGLYFYSAQVGSNTANATTRQLSVGNCQNSTALATYVNGQLGKASTSPASISATYTNPDGSGASASTVKNGGTVTLTITFNTFNMNFPLVPFTSSQITRTVQARVEDTTDEGCGA